MPYIKVNSSLLSKLNFISTRDIINMDEVDNLIRYYKKKLKEDRPDIPEAQQKAILKWFNRKKQGLRDYFRKNVKGDASEFYRKVKRITDVRSVSKVPEWLQVKLDESPDYLRDNEVYEVRDNLKADNQLVTKLDHMIDYFAWFFKESPSKSLVNMTWDHVNRGIKKWEDVRKKKKGTDELVAGEEIAVVSHDDYLWVELSSSEALENEGVRMDHCVGDYCDLVENDNRRIFSLRDPDNNPKITFSVNTSDDDDHSVSEVKGKTNSEVKGKYRSHVTKLLEWYHDNYGARLSSNTRDLESVGYVEYEGQLYDLEKEFPSDGGVLDPKTLDQTSIGDYARQYRYPQALMHITDIEVAKGILRMDGKSTTENVRTSLFQYLTGLSEDQIISLVEENVALASFLPDNFVKSKRVIKTTREQILKTKNFQLFYNLDVSIQQDVDFVISVFQEWNPDYHLSDNPFVNFDSSWMAPRFAHLVRGVKGNSDVHYHWLRRIQIRDYPTLIKSPEFWEYFGSLEDPYSALNDSLYSYITHEDNFIDHLIAKLKKTPGRFVKTIVKVHPDNKSYKKYVERVFPVIEALVSDDLTLLKLGSDASIIGRYILYKRTASDEFFLDLLVQEGQSLLKMPSRVFTSKQVLNNPKAVDQVIEDMKKEKRVTNFFFGSFANHVLLLRNSKIRDLFVEKMSADEVLSVIIQGTNVHNRDHVFVLLRNQKYQNKVVQALLNEANVSVIGWLVRWASRPDIARYMEKILYAFFYKYTEDSSDEDMLDMSLRINGLGKILDELDLLDKAVLNAGTLELAYYLLRPSGPTENPDILEHLVGLVTKLPVDKFESHKDITALLRSHTQGVLERETFYKFLTGLVQSRELERTPDNEDLFRYFEEKRNS